MVNELTQPLYKGSQVVWYTLFLVQGFLAIRLILKVLQANPEAVFTRFVYAITDVLVYPFAAVFQNVVVSSSVFEWTTVLAMVVYWLVAVAVIKLFIMSKPVSPFEADEKLTE